MSQSENLENIKAQFTRQADAYADTEQARDEKSMAALVRFSGAGPEHEILDVACGPGVFTRAFANICKRAVGVDVTNALLDKARAGASERKIENIEFVWGDVAAIPFETERFDFAVCRAAFHHFPDPSKVLGEMKRVVKLGGKIMIADLLSDEDPKKAHYHNHIERLCDPTHTRALPRTEFHRMFQDAALALSNEFQSEMHYDIEPWIDHGGPSEPVAAEIRELLGRSVEVDLCGLKVRKEADVLRFTHQTSVYLLDR
jgi:ubiquinone/menaquinone biosynthesis C-methylase UbiE